MTLLLISLSVAAGYPMARTVCAMLRALGVNL